MDKNTKHTDSVEKTIDEFMIQFPCLNSQCDLHGNIPHQISDDEWKPQQCQYCFEVRFPLRDRLRLLLAANQQQVEEAVKAEKRNMIEICQRTLRLGNIEPYKTNSFAFRDGHIKGYKTAVNIILSAITPHHQD